MREAGFLVISRENSICPDCGSPLKYRDRKLRIHREAGGKTDWLLIKRLKCTGEHCGRIHRELPDCVVPYKHYSAEIIEDVVDGVRTADDIETEDYPCEKTMDLWKWWLSKNENNINGQLRSMAYHLLELSVEFLRSGESLLAELRNRISPGWLSVVVRYIYNSGGRIEPNPES